MVIISSVIFILIHNITPVDTRLTKPYTSLLVFLLCFSITAFVWKLNSFINCELGKIYSWQKHPVKRLLIQVSIGILLSALIIKYAVHYFDVYLCTLPIEVSEKLTRTSIILGTLFTAILIAAHIGIEFFQNWKASLIEAEKYKKESTEAQLQNLKNQINPHFLFNNLSVLSSLVYKNQDSAVDFINQFSKVYRYILENQSKELVELETELKFIESYCFLLKIRFEKGFHYFNTIEKAFYKKLIPPMVLQLLVENTIKHNQTNEENPLEVTLSIEEDYITVKNNLLLRTLNEPSSKVGLKNITSRYKHFTNKEIVINSNQTYFEVKLPLL